jgi:riboflavin kinase/FMN adenylyltransferase
MAGRPRDIAGSPASATRQPLGFRAAMLTTLLPEVSPRPRRVAVGEFDGVHLGHREVIDGSDTVLTFEPHPLQVVRPEAAPKLLTSLAAKAAKVAALGVQELVVIPFDHGFSEQTPEEFVERVLVEKLRAERVSVGENFRFGRRAAGDIELLRSDGRFETRVVPLVEVDGEIVSSSHIRGLVLAGEVELATRFLGAPFQVTGEVVSGDRRGRELGYPTANLIPDEALVCPGHGVYAARADGVCAAVNVGVRPTFGTGRAVLIEAFLLDTDENLYGRRMTIDFLERLRGEKRFDSVESLVEQMRYDVEQTRRICEH